MALVYCSVIILLNYFRNKFGEVNPTIDAFIKLFPLDPFDQVRGRKGRKEGQEEKLMFFFFVQHR